MSYTGFTTVAGLGGDVIALPEGFKDIYSYAVEHAPQPNRPFWDLAERREELQAVKGNRVIFTKMKDITGIPAPTIESEEIVGTNLEGSQYWVDVQEYNKMIGFTHKAMTFNNNASIPDEAVLALGKHYQKTLNYICREAALSSGNVLYPNGKVAPGGLVAGTDGINTSLLMNGLKFLLSSQAPKYVRQTATGVEEVYVCVGHSDALLNLWNDPTFEAAQNYHQTQNTFTGELGRWRGIVFVASQAMPCGVDSYGEETYDATLHGVGAAGADLYKSVLLGAGAYGFAAAGPVQLIADPPRNAGRFFDLTWRRYMGATMFNSEYAVNLLTA